MLMHAGRLCWGFISMTKVLQRPARENEHKPQDMPLSAFLSITDSFNHKPKAFAMTSTHCAEPSPLPRYGTLAKICFGISNSTSLKKKKKFKVQMLVTIFLKWVRFLRWITSKKTPKLQSLQCLLPYKVLLAIIILIWSNKRGGVRTIALQLGCLATEGCRAGVPWTLGVPWTIGVPWIAPLAIWSWGWAQHFARQAPSSSSPLGHTLSSLFTEVGGLSSTAK